VDAGGPYPSVHEGEQLQLKGLDLLDDMKPVNPGFTTIQWQQVSGPGTATFADASEYQTAVVFNGPGLHVLRLTGDDGQIKAYEDVTIQVWSTSKPIILTKVGAMPVSQTSASLRGVLSTAETAHVWFCWGTVDGGVASTGDWQHVVSAGTVTKDVAFSSLVTGLLHNTTYFYRCYATNAYGTSWSDAVSFSGTPAGPELWTPANITKSVWYDASDDSTITAPGGLVNQWRDKSGNNNHLSQSGVNRPAVGTRTLAGRYALDFNKGSDQYMNLTTSINLLGKTLLMVGLKDAGSDMALMGTAASGYVQFLSTAGGDMFYDASTRWWTGGSVTGSSADYAGNGVGNIFGFVLNSSNIKSAQNGTLRTGNAKSGTVAPAVDRVGRTQVGQQWDGLMAEFIVLPNEDNTNRQLCEGYLAHKWGIAGNLPSSHPYKSFAPGGEQVPIANNAPTAISGTAATFNAFLAATGTSYDVYVCYGTSDGETNVGSWTSSAYVGSWTNVSTNVSYTASGLVAGLTYHYAFMASNATETVWGTPSWEYTAPGASQTCTLTVSTPHGTAVPGGVSLQPLNSVVNVSILDSPLLIGSTQYVCTGWIGTGSATNGSGTSTSFTITQDTTITWLWETNTVTLHTVIFDEGTHGARTGGGALTQQVVAGSSATAPNITPAPGYTFTGWDVSFANVTSDLTVHAQYSAIQYTLTYLAGAHGWISGTATQVVAYGASGTAVTAIPDTGYDFVNWSDSDTQNPRTDSSVAQSLSVTANFVARTPPVVSTVAGAVPVSQVSASLRGVLSSGETAQAWFCWGTADGGAASTGAWQYVVSAGAVTQGVAFSNLVTGLSTNTTYFYRCYATNAYGSDWSDTATFSGTPAGVVIAGGLWAPTNIVKSVWYDASDASTITTSGGLVSRWNDKSGNKNNATNSTATTQPGTGTRTIGGRNAIEFGLAGTKRFLAMSNSVDFVDRCVIGVFAIDTTGVSAQFIGSPNGENKQIGYNASQWRIAAVSNNWINGGTGEVSTTNTYDNAPHMVSYEGGSTLKFFIDGTQDPSTEGRENAAAYRLQTLGMYYPSSSAAFFDGLMGELIILASIPSVEDRQMLEGYLAHKWGIASNLPSGHPYKTQAPGTGAVVANIAPTAISGTAATLNASLGAAGTNYAVYVYYGTSNGETNAGSWTSSAYVGSWTNVSTNVSCAVSNLAAGTTYHYAFMASNSAGVVWASPSWTFRTVGTAGPTHTITASAGSGGSIAPSGDVAVGEGSDKTFTITLDTGYSIADVLVDSVSVGAVSSYTFSNVTAGHTITAAFAASQYTVTFDANGGTVPSPESKVVTCGSTYGTLATTSRSGCTFNGWFTAASGGTLVTSSTTVTITADQTLYAQWTALSALPSPWVKQDIGTIGLAGSATYSNGTFTVIGAGAGVKGTADALQFVNQLATADCDIKARVVSLTNAATAGKAGVMIRESLATNAREAGVWVTPANITFTYRKSTGGKTTAKTATGAAPRWVRLIRTGNSFAAYHSADGATWTQVGTSVNITMVNNVYIGMGVSSGATNTLATGTMDNVMAAP